MKKIIWFLTLFISVCAYGNTHILKYPNTPHSNGSSQTEKTHKTTDSCVDYYRNELFSIHQYEKDSINFILYFYGSTGQIQYAIYDTQKNNIPVPENSKIYCPGIILELRSYFLDFYESGNKKEFGVCLYDENPLIDYFEYGEWEKYDDFGKVIHNKYETESSVIFETFMNGQLNGTQVVMSKDHGHVQRINYYEIGVLKTQINFDRNNQITTIVYEITPNEASTEHKYKCNYIKYNTDGTKAKFCTMYFNDSLDGGEIQFP
mgnify:FL=1